MTRPLLVLRPEPGATATVEAARARGMKAIAAPLFVIRAIAWRPPDAPPGALLMTSANAARYGGPALAGMTRLPLYAVGEATARAARAAGFATIVTGDDGIDAILARALSDHVTSLLHIAGREHHPAASEGGVSIQRRIVYAAEAIDRLPPAARKLLPDVVALLHSARAAATFARLIEEAGLPRSRIRLAAISPAALAAAGTGWADVACALRPEECALLAAAAKLCDQ